VAEAVPCADAPRWMRVLQVLEMRLLPRCRAMSLQWSTLHASLEEGLAREGAGSAAAAAAVACAAYAFRFVCSNDEVLVARLRALQDPGLLVKLHGCRWAYLSARQGVRVQLGTARAHLSRAQVCPTWGFRVLEWCRGDKANPTDRVDQLSATWVGLCVR